MVKYGRGLGQEIYRAAKYGRIQQPFNVASRFMGSGSGSSLTYGLALIKIAESGWDQALPEKKR